jgi:hypothetical protein
MYVTGILYEGSYLSGPPSLHISLDLEIDSAGNPSVRLIQCRLKKGVALMLFPIMCRVAHHMGAEWGVRMPICRRHYPPSTQCGTVPVQYGAKNRHTKKGEVIVLSRTSQGTMSAFITVHNRLMASAES